MISTIFGTDSLCDLSHLQNVQILEVFDNGNLKQLSPLVSNNSALSWQILLTKIQTTQPELFVKLLLGWYAVDS